MEHKDYLSQSIAEAFEGMRANKGGPFGAVIVRNGEVIGKGNNMVTSTVDPTAHAEVVAIRNACKSVNHYHLTDAVMYASCEPCPMCLAAIYWADIREVYYCSDRYDAEKIGFDDNFIYEELSLPIEQRKMKFERMILPDAGVLFEEWLVKNDKKEY